MINIDTVVDKVLNHWGRDLQTNKAIEEMGELIAALMKSTLPMSPRKKRVMNERIIDEIADVQIMIRQLRLIYGPDLVDQRIEFKLNLVMNRIGGV